MKRATFYVSWSVQSDTINYPFKVTHEEACWAFCLPPPAKVLVFAHCCLCLPTQDGVVLVHCNAGVSRSSSVVIGYLMLRNKLPFEEAHRQVKTARPAVRPNPGFYRQLQLYEPWAAAVLMVHGGFVYFFPSRPQDVTSRLKCSSGHWVCAGGNTWTAWQ